MTVIRSSFIIARRLTESKYSLNGDTFQMSGITPEQVLILPDSVSAEEALPNALGLLLRLAVADGRLTDAELLSIQPALEGRLWQPGLEVKTGDLYTFGAFLWRCLQDHTTQGTWPPDLTPTLWRKLEVIHEDAVRVWVAGIDYVVGDEVAYPGASGELFVCQMAHTSQAGWEPPNAPSLWQAKTDVDDDTVIEDDTGLMNSDSAQQQEATEA